MTSDPNELQHLIIELCKKLKDDNDYFIPDWLRARGIQRIQGEKIIVCGSTCREEIKTLVNIASVLAIVDDNMAKKSSWIYGIPLITTNEWIELVKSDDSIVSCILVTTLRATRHFWRQCIQYDFKYITPIQFVHIMNRLSIKGNGAGPIYRYGFDYHKFGLENIDDFLVSKDLFVDTYSRLSYLSMIMYRLTLNPEHLEPIAVGRGLFYGYNTYLFERAYLALTESEIFVDAGAYTGDTIEGFLVAVRGKFKHIYSFEPDPLNYQEILKRIDRIQPDYIASLRNKISIINKGVWSEDAQLYFSTATEHDLGGHFVESGLGTNLENAKSNKVLVTSIDSSTNQDATFIKYEIEGSELEGLKGAEKTIEKNKPKLAVAVYHKPEDLLVIPRYVRKLDLGYKIGFRQHDPYKPDATYIYCY